MASRPHRTTEEIRSLRRRLEERGLLEKMQQICKEYNVLLEAVLAGRRTPRVVHARDACIVKALKVPMSTPEAGELFGMDHTSIISARQRYDTRDKGRLT